LDNEYNATTQRNKSYRRHASNSNILPTRIIYQKSAAENNNKDNKNKPSIKVNDTGQILYSGQM